MTYDSGEMGRGKELYKNGSRDIDKGLFDSGRSKLQQAKQIFEQCKDTDVEAKSWLAKTNQKLSESQA